MYQLKTFLKEGTICRLCRKGLPRLRRKRRYRNPWYVEWKMGMEPYWYWGPYNRTLIINSLPSSSLLSSSSSPAPKGYVLSLRPLPSDFCYPFHFEITLPVPFCPDVFEIRFPEKLLFSSFPRAYFPGRWIETGVLTEKAGRETCEREAEAVNDTQKRQSTHTHTPRKTVWHDVKKRQAGEKGKERLFDTHCTVDRFKEIISSVCKTFSADSVEGHCSIVRNSCLKKRCIIKQIKCQRSELLNE